MNSSPRAINFTHLAIKGTRKVLTECIGLKAGDVLALFWDETTDDTAKLFLEVAKNLGLNVHSRYVPLEEQTAFSANSGLSQVDREALDSARGIITCISNHVAGTAYRTELLRVGADGGKRFGHMPGADLSVLAHAVNVDYVEASSRCDDLALALTLGQTVRLETYIPDAAGSAATACDLSFQIGGLLRSPITSTGIIPLGTWGNLPGGETFIAPIEDTANGVFVLNGAFKNYVIKPPGYLRLHFEKGRLIGVDGTPAEEIAFNAILDFARSHDDSFYDSLAELGIGVNRGIKELTGNALFDEKCYGTAHIAIGDSSRYGGMYSSMIHEDLISRRPSLWIDGKPILNQGRDVFNPDQWREKLEDYVVTGDPLNSECMVTRTIIAAERGPYGRLSVRRSVSAGRICNYTIAEPTTSRILGLLYSWIPRLPQQIKLSDLARHCEDEFDLSLNLTKAAVAILVRHGVVDARLATSGDV